MSGLIDLALERAGLRRARETGADLREIECPSCRRSLDQTEVRRVDPDDDDENGEPRCRTCAGLRQLVILRLPDDGGIDHEALHRMRTPAPDSRTGYPEP